MRSVVTALRPEHLRRYRALATLLVRYGRSDLVRDGALRGELDPAADTADLDLDGPVPPDALRLAADLEAMGPTYVKLGQLLSTRPDIIAPEYATALARLQDRVQPLPLEEIQGVLDEELGSRRPHAFSWFEPEPLASASLGQVHRATLMDGRHVAVKVQRPGVRAVVLEDMDALAEVARFLDDHTRIGRRYGFLPLIELFRRSLLDELDYRREAENLDQMAAVLADFGRLFVPRPFHELTTSRLLVMELVHGTKLPDVTPAEIRAAGGPELADELFRGYLQQILVEGFFHADPHPGNVLLAGSQLALIDLGMVARVPPATRDQLVRMLLAVSEGDARRTAAAIEAVSDPLEDYDQPLFENAVGQLLERNASRTVSDLQAGPTVLALTQASVDAGLRPAPALSMLGKALMNLDEVTQRLDPDFDPSAALERHANEVLRDRLKPSGAGLMSAALETKEFVEQLPARVNRVLDAAASGSFELKVRAFDEAEMLRGLQKLANRVTMGLVLAALIVGAAMLMRVQTSARLFGYPALGIVCFLAAALGGLALLISIVWSDRRTIARNKR